MSENQHKTHEPATLNSNHWLDNGITGNPNLIAYSLGYTTHYVTDVVGHPFVNQVVGGPWRLYWQRQAHRRCA